MKQSWKHMFFLQHYVIVFTLKEIVGKKRTLTEGMHHYVIVVH